MSEHERQAEQADRELADMEHRSDQVREEIERARRDWESKKGDERVPGADAEAAPAEEPPPEADFPAGR